MEKGVCRFGWKKNEISIFDISLMRCIEIFLCLGGKIFFICHDMASTLGPQHYLMYGKGFGEIKLLTFFSHVRDVGWKKKEISQLVAHFAYYYIETSISHRNIGKKHNE